jgi:hypothetical protein
MNGAIKKKRLNLILLESLAVLFTITVNIVIVILASASPLIAGEHCRQEVL